MIGQRAKLRHDFLELGSAVEKFRKQRGHPARRWWMTVAWLRYLARSFSAAMPVSAQDRRRLQPAAPTRDHAAGTDLLRHFATREKCVEKIYMPASLHPQQQPPFFPGCFSGFVSGMFYIVFELCCRGCCPWLSGAEMSIGIDQWLRFHTVQCRQFAIPAQSGHHAQARPGSGRRLGKQRAVASMLAKIITFMVLVHP